MSEIIGVLLWIFYILLVCAILYGLVIGWVWGKGYWLRRKLKYLWEPYSRAKKEPHCDGVVRRMDYDLEEHK